MIFDFNSKIIEINSFQLSSKFEGGKIHGHKKNVKNIGIIELVSNDGYKGYAENYLATYSPNIFKATVIFLNKYIIGKKINEIDVNKKKLIPFISRNGFVKSVLGSIETALIDLIGKKTNLPAYKLLGIINKRIQCYYSGGSVVMSPKEIEKDVEVALSQKFKYYKMRIGFKKWSHDIARIKKAKKTLGKKNTLIIDAIMGTHQKIWNKKEAIKKINSLKKFNPLWIEEPLHPDDVEGYIELIKKIKIPIAAGEAYTGDYEYINLINQKLIKYLQLDVSCSGGYSFCKEISSYAKKKNIKVIPHCWGSVVAVASNLSLAQSIQNRYIFEIPSVKLEISKYIAENSVVIKNGFIEASDVSGYGFNFSNKIKNKFKYKSINTFKI